MNKVCLVGRLTFNSDVNEFNYKKVAKFTVAVDRGLSKEAKQNAKQTSQEDLLNHKIIFSILLF